MAEGIPINKDLVAWARKRAGISVQEATEKFKHIRAWESGEALPSYPQLEAMADEFKLPVAVFFFPEPPTLPPIRESFRTLPDAEFDQLPRSVRFMLQKAKALQLNLAELTQGNNPARRIVTRDLRFPDNISPADMAARVREYFGITVADQAEWADADVALKAWRATLQDGGIFVFKDAFRAPDFCGFSLDDETFPIIYVNNSAAKTRQIFTLFHELGHLLFHTSGVDKLSDDYVDRLGEQQKRIEVLCNRFAAQFLVPEADFVEAMAERAPDAQAAETLAARFHVSREVIYRMFLDRHWIDQAEYRRAANEWSAQRKDGNGGDYYRTKIAYLGREYIGLAFRQYYQKKIDEAQLAEYLETKSRNVVTLEQYFTAGQA